MTAVKHWAFHSLKTSRSTMSNKQDLLIEVGTEEMPPTSLKRLALAFHDEVQGLLENERLNFASMRWLATPRRLVLLISAIDTAQADVKQDRRGPSVDVAFDEDGKPTKATEGFARSCGVSVEQLTTKETDKGSWLMHSSLVKGKTLAELLPAIVETALGKLPIAKRMRWGDSDVEFVRPIKWFFFLLGNEAIRCNVMGMTSQDVSYGHRFHHPQPIQVKSVGDYLEQLKTEGRVIVDYQQRRAVILDQVRKLAAELEGEALIDEGLLDEVTALVEWPVAFVGEFNPDFLRLPREVLIATMQDHQKYFPVIDQQDQLQACFIGVANIESAQPHLVKEGNERVIQPRLSDAAFFWQRDLQRGLSSHIDGLAHVLYQKQLGNLHDRMQRLMQHANYLSQQIGADPDKTRRAAELCFCDLLTEMVFEFPELQGIMGKYYAEAAGEDAEVCAALDEFYRPRFAGDVLPANKVGQSLAIAEKIDSLLGIFAIGKAPTGARDPFALRRSAIGLLRILIEGELDVDLRQLLQQASNAFPDTIKTEEVIEQVLTFLQERLRRYYLDEGVDNDVVEAVLAVCSEQPLDFHQRLQAVTNFRKLPEAESLAAANKRIANILKKSEVAAGASVDAGLLQEQAEKTLASLLDDYRQQLQPLMENRDYQASLALLAGLREAVDSFFDNVMVMCEDDKIKQNRLALLQNLNTLFLEIADISRLQG